MHKYIIILLLSLNLYSSEYSVELDGDKIATVASLSTIERGFLQSELNWKASLYSGYDFFVVYDGKKVPTLKNAKYVKDEAGLLSILRFFKTTNTPIKPIKIENSKQFLSLNCKNDLCKFSAQNKINLTTYKGYIRKKGNTILDIYETKNKLRIRLI